MDGVGLGDRADQVGCSAHARLESDAEERLPGGLLPGWGKHGSGREEGVDEGEGKVDGACGVETGERGGAGRLGRRGRDGVGVLGVLAAPRLLTRVGRTEARCSTWINPGSGAPG